LANTTGSGNTAVGATALAANITGSDNIALGTTAGSNVISASNVICIGADGANVSFGCYIGQIYGNFTSGVFISSDGKLATSPSSRRFKEEIKPMEQASEVLFALNPVTFRYKKGIDPQGIPQFGLVAEDVEKVNPDLIIRDPDGKAHMLRYEQINAMLLNEFLKEHRRVEELRSAIAQQRKATEALVARLNEQEARIQKVSAQIEIAKSEAQMLVENR
jgi:trimeric autotransporter adhesin